MDTQRAPIPWSGETHFESVVGELANFRYRIRKFIRFSESEARKAGVTPQQHQLMLGIAGFNGTGRATVSELAEFLQERHHSVVGLIDRAVSSGLVKRENDSTDRRVVLVSLTPRGGSILKRLSLTHEAEVRRLRDGLLRFALREDSPLDSASPDGSPSRNDAQAESV